MLVAADIDGCAAAYPDELGALLQALRACGHTVVFATGTALAPATDEDAAQKASYLKSLGLGECYDELYVYPPPHDENKAALLASIGCDILIDNSKDNAKACADICLTLVTWQTRK